VRLKGGDPFVFGRGGEEALACAEAGVPFEVVPGVTAGTAAPASVGVPVTHRDYTKGVVLITGHARGDGELDLPWASLARCGLTLVFFMGVSTIERIARELVAHGLDPTTPVLVVQEGTLPTERHVVASLADAAEAVRREGIRAPAVVVVGGVASLASKLAASRPQTLQAQERSQTFLDESMIQAALDGTGAS
jgi:siroheme synthase